MRETEKWLMWDSRDAGLDLVGGTQYWGLTVLDSTDRIDVHERRNGLVERRYCYWRDYSLLSSPWAYFDTGTVGRRIQSLVFDGQNGE